MTERLVGPAAALLACLLFIAAFQQQTSPLSPQSLANRHFANNPSYATAVGELLPVWPPLYPSVLWGAARLGIPPHASNALLFFGALALLYPLGRRVAPEVAPVWGIALYASAGFNAFNLHQLVSEALLVPLSLGVLALTMRCVERGRNLDYASLALLLAASCLTRYFALAWLVPIVGLSLALHGVHSTRGRAARAAAVLAGSCLPVALWMVHVRTTTGFLTGMERFTPRVFESQTNLLGNVSHSVRTFAIDFLAPGVDASHSSLAAGSVLGRPGTGWLTLGVVGLAVGLVLLCAVVAVRARHARGATRSGDAGVTQASGSTDMLSLILPGLSLGYVAVLIVVWTLGNNDPIYSRFLYPSYVFFVLAGIHVYSQARTVGADPRPFQALYALLLASQAVGTLIEIAR